MNGEIKLVWLVAFGIKLARGEIVADAASGADKAVQVYRNRFTWTEPDD